MSTAIIVGLGNPGNRYRDTWHNAGFWIVDRFAGNAALSFRSGRSDYHYAKGEWEGSSVLLVKPTTFMNLSGHAVADVLNFFNGDPSQLFVIYDDHDLKLGSLRIRRSGSDGGHKGVRSIIECLGTQVFNRLRLGIRPADGVSGNLVNKVLSAPPDDLRKTIDEISDRAVQAVECYIKSGIVVAMNQFNRVQTDSDSSL